MKKIQNYAGCIVYSSNSGLNIKNGDHVSAKGKQIVKALNGDGPRDEKTLEREFTKGLELLETDLTLLVINSQFTTSFKIEIHSIILSGI